MSKFWGADESESESSSSSSESEAEAVQQRPRVMQRWAEASSSEDEDTQKRVVRSQKDKRFDELRNAVKQLRNHMKVNDFALVATDYEALMKGLRKAQAAKGVSDDDGTPRIFIRAITELEKYIDAVFAEGTKKLKENKAKAFNTLRSKVRKGNKEYSSQVEQCKSNPTAFESANEDEEEEEEEDDSSSASSEESSDSSSDSSDSSDNDDSSDGGSSWEEDEDEELDGDLDEATMRERKLMKWLIDSDDEDEEEVRKRKKDEKEAKRLEASKKKESSRAAKLGQVGTEVEGDGIGDDMKLEDVQKKIKELAQLRGRKGVDKHDMFRQFEALLRVSEKFGAVEPLTILTLFISAEFDQTTGAFQAMHLPTWTTVLQHCKKMLELLYSDPQAAARNLNSDEEEPEEEADEEDDEEEEEERPAQPAQPQATNARSLTVSSLTAFLEKLDDELFKALQLTDVHTAQYQERLGASVNLITLLKNSVQFHKENKTEDGAFRHKGDLSRLALRLVEHLYYKHDDVNIAVRNAVLRAEELTPQETEAWKRDPSEEIYEYCTFIHAHGQMREKLRAVLCQTYHHALHGRFYHARDLMQLSGVQETVQNADILTLILFNRALVMVGLGGCGLGLLPFANFSLL
jgi:translation initiation factor 3 subunit C